jgi:hypothetical protein
LDDEDRQQEYGWGFDFTFPSPVPRENVEEEMEKIVVTFLDSVRSEERKDGIETSVRQKLRAKKRERLVGRWEARRAKGLSVGKRPVLGQ